MQDLVTVTATFPDGTKWGWPGEPVFRYEGPSGWAWVPCNPAVNEQVGDILDLNAGSLEEYLVFRKTK